MGADIPVNSAQLLSESWLAHPKLLNTGAVLCRVIRMLYDDIWRILGTLCVQFILILVLHS
jgi:hypothetical protein